MHFNNRLGRESGQDYTDKHQEIHMLTSVSFTFWSKMDHFHVFLEYKEQIWDSEIH